MKRLDPLAVPLSRTQLIEASAGTGKTFTITSLYLRLVLDGYQVNEILVVTFTEAAMAELRDRLRQRLRDVLKAFQQGGGDSFIAALVAGSPNEERPLLIRRIEAALGGFDQAAVMTIHSFCRRMLIENAFESKVLFDAELLTDPSDLYEEIVTDLWTLRVYALPRAWVTYLQEKQVSPSFLIQLLRKTAGRATADILPELSDSAQEDVSTFQSVYHAGRTMWLAEQAAIRSLLATHRGVNRRSYNKKNLSRWLENVDAYFANETPARLPGDKDLEKFTQSRFNETANRIKNTPAPPVHPFFNICDTLCRFGASWLVAFQRRFLDDALHRLTDRKRQLGIQFFDDLIQDLDSALSCPAGDILADRIRHRFRAALIDEFQDTDQIQYRIFRRIYQGSSCPFFLIGDPKQSIYAFRGADIFTYLQAVSDAGENAHTLTVNWRSDPSMIRAVNLFFNPERIVRPFGLRHIDYPVAVAREDARDLLVENGRAASSLQILFVPRNNNINDKTGLINKAWMDDHLPEMIAGDICALLSGKAVLAYTRERPVLPGDIAVLVRTNAQAFRMQEALGQAGLPCVITGTDSVFQSREALELRQVLDAIAEAPRQGGIANALATDLFGYTANEIDAFQGADGAWEGWITTFKDWHYQWRHGGFIQMIQRMFTLQPTDRSAPLMAGLLTRPDGERRVTNYQHLSELLQSAAVKEQLGPTGLLAWFDTRRRGRAETEGVHELRLESDAGAVQVVTVHKSKGLEYPVVYAPYLWDGSLQTFKRPPAVCHDPLDTARTVFDLGSDQLDAHLAQACFEEMAENIRLLYVALTRARHACRVVWGAANGFNTSALGYLLHSPGYSDGFQAVADFLMGLDDEQIEKELSALATAADGAITVRALTGGEASTYSPEKAALPTLHCRKAGRISQRHWRVESFSSLVDGPRHTTMVAEKIGADYDHQTGGFAPISTAQSPDPDGPILLSEFSRGAVAGTFFHAVLEVMDFTLADPEAFNTLVETQLAAFGFHAADWRHTVSRALSDTVHCDLDRKVPGLRLSAVSNDKRFNELEFLFPVATGENVTSSPVTAEKLAALFSAHASGIMTAETIARISALRFAAIQGFLKGFIDLVFEFQGKWYIVDYKSNFLGDGYTDYDACAIARAMAAHHYFLQYHIYTLALHRYLSLRLPGYAYDTHFGGVYYLFFRGMSPKTGPAYGVFKDRPSKALIEAFSELL